MSLLISYYHIFFYSYVYSFQDFCLNQLPVLLSCLKLKLFRKHIECAYRYKSICSVKHFDCLTWLILTLDQSTVTSEWKNIIWNWMPLLLLGRTVVFRKVASCKSDHSPCAPSWFQRLSEWDIKPGSKDNKWWRS